MRIACLYDVHGNLPALEAVLDEVPRVGAELIVVGGDVVPGPMPVACLELLRSQPLPTRWIRGNGEVDTVATASEGPPARVPEAFHEVMRWVAEALGPEHLRIMERWPLTHVELLDGLGPVHFCHATPRDENEIVTRNTPEEELREVFERTGAELVVCGHTHMPFDRRIGSVRVVNAGSVGMPFGDLAAQWLIVDETGVRRRRTDYDLAAAMASIRRTGYPFPLDLERPPSEAAMLQVFDAAPRTT